MSRISSYRLKEKFLDFFLSVMVNHANGIRRAADNLGNLSVRHLVIVTEIEYRALSLCKIQQGLIEAEEPRIRVRVTNLIGKPLGQMF